MNRTSFPIPYYIKASLFFIGAIAFVYILILGQDIIVPIIYSALISIMLNPLVAWLERKGMNNLIAIFLAVFLAILFTIGLSYFIASQLSSFATSLPVFSEKISRYITEAENFVSGKFKIDPVKVHGYVLKTKADLLSNSGIMIGHTLTTITGILIAVFLMPVYIMMISYYQPLFLEFIVKVFSKQNHAAVAEVMIESKAVIQSYLGGLLIEAVIIAIMNSVGLLILGIEYAVLIGILGAILNIIPYIGGIIAVAIPMFIAMITRDSFSYPLLVLALYSVIQFIDNNLIVPRIVASRVKINAFVSVVVVLAGGAIWGVPGMFLSIPLTAIIKIIFDRVEILKPWGFLLGDSMPETSGFIRIFKNFKTAKMMEQEAASLENKTK
jgi:predicted PurR-regulated permease PerM